VTGPGIDHLVYAVPRMEPACEALERLTGVRAAPGGVHPGQGTRNALLSLGPGCYLEIIGPDPEQAPPPEGRWFGIDHLEGPRLATWARRVTNLEKAVRRAEQAGIAMGTIRQGARTRADGVRLCWTLTDPRAMPWDGLIPFLIEWGSSPHPSSTAPGGIGLRGLRGEHPEARRVQADLRALQLSLEVRTSDRPALVASLETPRGTVELR
jgi:Glyoxalase-like domain